MRSHPALIIQSNCCLHVIVEFHPGMKMYKWPATKIFSIIPRDIPRDNVTKLHLKKIQVQMQVYKESNISVYVIIMF